MTFIITELVHIFVKRPAEARRRVWDVLDMSKTHLWPLAVLCSLVGLLFLCHIPYFNYQFSSSHSVDQHNSWKPEWKKTKHIVLNSYVDIYYVLRVTCFNAWKHFILSTMRNCKRGIYFFTLVKRCCQLEARHNTLVCFTWS